MFCSECGHRLEEGNTNCSSCASVKNENQPQPPAPLNAPSQNNNQGAFSGFNVQDFLNFNIMITPLIMKIFYIVGVVGITLGLFVMAVLTMRFQVGLGLLQLFVFLPVSLILHRVFCEQLMLFFSIRKELMDINKKT